MQFVTFGDVVSDPVALEKGVPQGSILESLLFLLYVTTVCNQMKQIVCHKHADDTIMYSSAPSVKTAVNKF